MLFSFSQILSWFSALHKHTRACKTFDTSINQWKFKFWYFFSYFSVSVCPHWTLGDYWYDFNLFFSPARSLQIFPGFLSSSALPVIFRKLQIWTFLHHWSPSLYYYIASQCSLITLHSYEWAFLSLGSNLLLYWPDTRKMVNIDFLKPANQLTTNYQSSVHAMSARNDFWESKPLCTFLQGGNVHDYALYNLGHITFWLRKQQKKHARFDGLLCCILNSMTLLVGDKSVHEGAVKRNPIPYL